MPKYGRVLDFDLPPITPPGKDAFNTRRAVVDAWLADLPLGNLGETARLVYGALIEVKTLPPLFATGDILDLDDGSERRSVRLAQEVARCTGAVRFNLAESDNTRESDSHDPFSRLWGHL